MPHTNFPFGVTVSTSTSVGVRTAAGEIYSDTLNIQGASSLGGSLSVSTAQNGIIGQVAALAIQFGTGSAAQVYSMAMPFTGDIIGAFVTIGSVSAVAAGYTVRAGSAGSIAVATVANTITTAYAGESLTTTRTAVTTAQGIQVTRAAQGTAGDTGLTVLIQRTA